MQVFDQEQSRFPLGLRREPPSQQAQSQILLPACRQLFNAPIFGARKQCRGARPLILTIKTEGVEEVAYRGFAIVLVIDWRDVLPQQLNEWIQRAVRMMR